MANQIIQPARTPMKNGVVRRSSAEVDADLASPNSTCRRCGETKPKSEFPKDKKQRSGLSTRCLICNRKKQNSYLKGYREKYPERLLTKRLSAECEAVGITLEYFNSLPKECRICGAPEGTRRNGKPIRLSKDHDHKTGRFRGLLCHKHNQVLGLVDDSVEQLQKLISYLKQHQGV